MSAWQGKYVIGLTGNIATGKSLVRKMLQRLGAYGIDADSLAHQTFLPGQTGYDCVLESFGEQILKSDGQIDRSKLGAIVFSDENKLSRLEAIIHPLVGMEIDRLIQSFDCDIFVIEAIKLIEAKLHDQCDTLWVTISPRDIQLARLMKDRNMSKYGALQRINAQPAQEEKINLADIVIQNHDSIENTWEQVVNAWKGIFPESTTPDELPEKFLVSNIQV